MKCRYYDKCGMKENPYVCNSILSKGCRWHLIIGRLEKSIEK